MTFNSITHYFIWMAAMGHKIKLIPELESLWWIFWMDRGAKVLIQGSKKSYQQSKHVSRRVVTELRLKILLTQLGKFNVEWL